MLLVVLFVAACGNNDCPSGVNTTNPSCPNYTQPYPYQYGQGGQQYGQPCQPGTPNCVNGYYQPQQTPCQPGTPGCVNGYMQQYPQYPQTQPYPYGQPRYY